MVPPGVPPRVGFVDFEPLHQSQEWLTVPFWNRLSVDHMTDAFWINRIQFSSQTGGGTLTLRGGYPRFRVRESGHRTFRLATQILHAYRMVHKINTDRLYEMHGTPGGTMRDPELKIVDWLREPARARRPAAGRVRASAHARAPPAARRLRVRRSRSCRVRGNDSRCADAYRAGVAHE
jgi:hypothetical protein